MQGIRIALFGAVSGMAMIAAGVVQAQDAAAATEKKPVAAVDEVVVTGVRASMRDAIQQKRASSAIVEVISSKDIGVLPDVTIAEELDRLPGVNATRDRGNDSQAAVRGLGPRLVLGLVNGREVASSEPDRNVRWEIYPSEAVSGVSVYKSQSADLIAGGVAATIDIKTIRPLDYSGPSLVGRIGPVYYDGGQGLPHYDPLGYRGSLELIHKFNDDLAVAVGGSYQSQKNGYTSFQGWGYNDAHTGGSPPTLNGVATPTPWGAQTEVDRLTETRGSVTGSVQWKPTNNFELTADVLYSDVKIDETQNQAWYGANNTWGDWGGNNANNWDPYYAGAGSFTLQNGDVVGGTQAGTPDWQRAAVTNAIAHYTEDKKLVATGVNGVWTNDNWKVRGDLSYSEAHRTNTWEAILSRNATSPSSMSFYTGTGGAPWVTASSSPADVNSQVPLYGEADGPEHLNDALGAAQLDFTRNLHGDFFTGVDFGARYSNRIKSHDLYQWYPAPIVGVIPSGLLSNFNANGLNVPALLDGDFNKLAAAVYGGGFNSSNAVFQKASYWRVRETDSEAYAKVNFKHDLGSIPMAGNIGVRVVSVWVQSQGYEQVGSAAPDAIDIGHHYTDVLPSLGMTFHLNDNNVLRFSAARVIARPPLDEMRASRTISLPTAIPPTGSAGNPTLNPFRANQVDLSYEWYFHPESLFAAAIYYKEVSSNIGYKTSTADINGTNYTITGPFNGKGGGMEGVEFTFQTPFYFIPHLEHFGIYSNLALADSNIKEFTPVNNPLPMVGLAKTTAEVDLWYSQNGVDARLGFKHHSPFTVIYGWDASKLTTLESENILDFSASYPITHHLTVRFQANNLTDQVARFYWDNKPDRLARYDTYGRRFLIDFSFKY
ncbi:MAG: TonB-dependent receptor [Caulobacteraceae bacterium]|nr:TonB-dependent receptor [Caulobacteraceae bacterium]